MQGWFFCTAYLKVTEDLKSKLVHVEYCFFYYIHMTQLIGSFKDLRKDIAFSAKEMMSSGIFPIQQSESSWKLHHRHLQTSTSSSIKL